MPGPQSKNLTTESFTLELSMPRSVLTVVVLFAGSYLSGASHSVRGDEPVKPTAPASETNPAVPAPGHSVHGEAFNDGPRHAAYLMSGMGKVHFPVTTKEPEAQTFIDQGVAQLHSFYYFESERSFRQAAKIDPSARWPTGGWRWRMSTTRSALQSFSRKRASEQLR